MFFSQTVVLDYPAHTPIHLKTEFCVEDCLDCVRACEQCAQDCLRGLPLRLTIEYRALLLETADTAFRAAQAVAQKSRDMSDACWVCVQMCTACINEFEQYETESFKRCIAACRRCAESCQEVVDAR